MKLVLAVQSAPRRLLVYDFATGAAAILVDRVESPTPCAGKVLRERYNRGFEKGLRTSCKGDSMAIWLSHLSTKFSSPFQNEALAPGAAVAARRGPTSAAH